MGGCSWRDEDFRTYSTSVGRTVDHRGAVVGDYDVQEVYRARRLDPALDPKGVIRECCDCEEHPNVTPVILALDVTGSMGDAAIEVAKKLGVVMGKLYKEIPDVQFMTMGIGDMAYDEAPLQVSQFESDIRIAEQLDKIWFEHGGGGNSYESYSLAWYFALKHTKIDAIDKRGKKPIIITMGDEPLNPYIPLKGRETSVKGVLGDSLQADIETKELYDEVQKKFECYHIYVDHDAWFDWEDVRGSFEEIMGGQRVLKAKVDEIEATIVDIVKTHANKEVGFVENIIGVNRNENGEITW